MKTAYLLFGLASAACEPAQADTQFPLCDRAGAPACGNIGQVGRRERAKPQVAVVAPALAQLATAAQRVGPVVTRVLLGASSQAIAHGTPFAGPLFDHAKKEPACGNVMSKGGGRRTCHSASGMLASETELDNDGNLVAQTTLRGRP